jgi:hypothetical protein
MMIWNNTTMEIHDMNPTLPTSPTKITEPLPEDQLHIDTEAEISNRLSKLDDFARRLFYQHRARCRTTGILSSNALDLLTLEALEQSSAYRTASVLS